jgi:hypothetical protein
MGSFVRYQPVTVTTNQYHGVRKLRSYSELKFYFAKCMTWKLCQSRESQAGFFYAAKHSRWVSSFFGRRAYMGGDQRNRWLPTLLMNGCPQDTNRRLVSGHVTWRGNYYPTRQIRCRIAKRNMAIRTSARRNVPTAASHFSTCGFTPLSYYVQFLHCHKPSATLAKLKTWF